MWKSKLKTVFVGASIFLVGAFFSGVGVKQAEAAAAQKVSFSVEANTQFDNQLSKGASYFDLKMDRGQKQNISVKIYNSSNKKIIVNSKIETGMTSNSVGIAYVDKLNGLDSSLKYPMSRIVTLLDNSKSIGIPAYSNVSVNAEIVMPEESFTGVVIGGWRFSLEDSKKNNEKNQATITNEYNYLVGIKLTENKEVEPNLKLKKVGAVLDNGYRAIGINIQNPKSVIISKVKLETKIYQEGRKKAFLTSTTNNNLSIAPNSNFTFPIRYGLAPLQSGKYRMEMTATSNDPKYLSPHVWHFKKNFTITNEKIEELNKTAVDVPKESHLWIWILLAGITILLLIIIIIVLLKKQKKSKDVESNE